MKEFVKMTLAVMCGLFLMGIVGFFLLISAVGSLIAAAGSSSSTVVLPREGVLAMDMSKYSFVEVANPNTDFQALLQGQEIITPVSIWSAVQAVRKAAQDPGVKFLYLKPDGMSIGLAAPAGRPSSPIPKRPPRPHYGCLRWPTRCIWIRIAVPAAWSTA